MTPEQLFSIANTVALIGWIALAVAGRRALVSSRIAGVFIPMVLAGVYAVLIAWQFPGSEGGFGTLAAVALLFRNPWALLAGWIHYLAFDLFIGSWQVRDAARLGIPHWQTLPCLFATFLFGPAGLLAYFVLRQTHGARLAIDEAKAKV